MQFAYGEGLCCGVLVDSIRLKYHETDVIATFVRLVHCNPAGVVAHRATDKGCPDYAPSSSYGCRLRETGVQEATRRRFPGPGRRFAASGEPSWSIAFRVRSSDELGA